MIFFLHFSMLLDILECLGPFGGGGRGRSPLWRPKATTRTRGPKGLDVLVYIYIYIYIYIYLGLYIMKHIPYDMGDYYYGNSM